MVRLVVFILIALHFSSSFAAENTRNQNSNYAPLQATRLVFDADHTQFLKDTLATATKSVMISSYSVSPKRLFVEGLGKAIISAADRGIDAYVYYESRPWLPQEEYASLEMVASHCAVFEDNDNHSKCVIKDKSTIAIGSYNWLSDTWEGSSNGSIIVTGELALGLIDNVWQGIRFYQSLAYGNERGIDNFLNDQSVFSIGECQFSPGQFLYNLRTPDAHGLFLEDVLAKARSRVVMLSPFIRLTKFQEFFSTERLSMLQKKGVYIQVITLPSPCDNPEERQKIFATFENLYLFHSNFHHITHPNFHAKTLITDNDLICDGSINWLSAVTEIDHDANNFEMSVAIRGTIASGMIQDFERASFGQSILQRPMQITQAPTQTVQMSWPKKDLVVVSPTKQASSQLTKKPRFQEDYATTEHPPFKSPTWGLFFTGYL